MNMLRLCRSALGQRQPDFVANACSFSFAIARRFKSRLTIHDGFRESLALKGVWVVVGAVRPVLVLLAPDLEGISWVLDERDESRISHMLVKSGVGSLV